MASVAAYDTLRPSSGLLPFADTRAINISHLSCTLIGHATIVACCSTSQCIRLNLTLPRGGVTRRLTICSDPESEVTVFIDKYKIILLQSVDLQQSLACQYPGRSKMATGDEIASRSTGVTVVTGTAIHAERDGSVEYLRDAAVCFDSNDHGKVKVE